MRLWSLARGQARLVSEPKATQPHRLTITTTLGRYSASLSGPSSVGTIMSLWMSSTSRCGSVFIRVATA